jgi:hypothetical protein
VQQVTDWQITEWQVEAALKAAHMHSTPESRKDMRRAIEAALREALVEQPAQQEPFATVYSFNDLGGVYELVSPPKYRPPVGSHLYTSPPAQRKPLTDEEIIASNYPDGEENGPTIAAPDFELVAFARQIEAKLKEKNT